MVRVQHGFVADVALRLVDVEHTEEIGERRRVAATHVLREGGPEVTRRLLQMIVRDLAEQVVNLVRADVVRQLVCPAVVAVNGRQLTADVRPGAVAVPQHAGVHVVEERDDDEPRGEHHERRDVVAGEGGDAVDAGVGSKHTDPGADGADRQRAAEHVAGEHRLERVEVAHAARHEAGEQIEEPADAEAETRIDVVEVSRLVALADRVEDLVAVDVGRVAVVVTVRQLPRVERHEKDRVQERAEHVVDAVILREGAVAAVVAQHEHRPQHRALQEPVDGRGGDVQHADRLPLEQQHGAVEPADQQRVLADEVQRAGEVAAETVRRDDFLYVDDRRYIGRLQRLVGTRGLVGGDG